MRGGEGVRDVGMESMWRWMMRAICENRAREKDGWYFFCEKNVFGGVVVALGGEKRDNKHVTYE